MERSKGGSESALFLDLATDIGVSTTTIKSWLSALEASHVIHVLEPFHGNVGKRLIKTPKVYFLDTGLACFLAGLTSEQAMRDSTLLGPIFESHVLGQIIKRHAARAERAEVFFYRDVAGREIDFLLKREGKWTLIECKCSTNPSSRSEAFEAVGALIGAQSIHSFRIATPERTLRNVGKDGGVFIGDSVDW